MSYDTKRLAFNWSLFFGVIAIGLLLALFAVIIGGRIDGESVWKRARRIESEFDQAVAESEALGTALADATGQLREITAALRDATERVGELESDNLRALELVGNITSISVSLAEGSGDIERLGRELADEIERALETVQRLQIGIETDND